MYLETVCPWQAPVDHVTEKNLEASLVIAVPFVASSQNTSVQQNFQVFPYSSPDKLFLSWAPLSYGLKFRKIISIIRSFQYKKI
jgi:hypothetical protein